jgi:tetratricopeptide (TPR) repeat protein
MMWFYKKLLIYRFYIGIALLVISVALAFLGEWEWFSVSLFLALLAIISHLVFGPLRLIQEAIQAQDMVLAQKYIDMVHFPKLLFKPLRQAFYMIKSNIAMSNKDYTTAESFMKQSLESKSNLLGNESEGPSYLQMGMIALQNGKNGDARKNFRLAISKGLPDDETLAAAYLQLSSLEIQARNYKIGKEYFKKAKQLNPKTPEIKSQLLQMEKYIHRVR